jgi:hypothetical protein
VNNELARKIKGAIERAAAKRGGVDFAAVVLRENSPNRWDIVLAAPWLARDERGTLDLFYKQLRRVLKMSEFLQISHIALLDRVDPASDPLPAVVPVGDDLGRAGGPGRFLGVDAKDAYFLIANGALQRS